MWLSLSLLQEHPYVAESMTTGYAGDPENQDSDGRKSLLLQPMDSTLGEVGCKSNESATAFWSRRAGAVLKKHMWYFKA